MGAHALLAGTEKVIGQQPFAQGDVAVCEDRPNRDGKLLPAPAALPYTSADVCVLLGLFRFQPVGSTYFAAVGADRAVRPAELL